MRKHAKHCSLQRRQLPRRLTFPAATSAIRPSSPDHSSSETIHSRPRVQQQHPPQRQRCSKHKQRIVVEHNRTDKKSFLVLSEQSPRRPSAVCSQLSCARGGAALLPGGAEGAEGGLVQQRRRAWAYHAHAAQQVGNGGIALNVRRGGAAVLGCGRQLRGRLAHLRQECGGQDMR